MSYTVDQGPKLPPQPLFYEHLHSEGNHIIRLYVVDDKGGKDLSSILFFNKNVMKFVAVDHLWVASNRLKILPRTGAYFAHSPLFAYPNLVSGFTGGSDEIVLFKSCMLKPEIKVSFFDNGVPKFVSVPTSAGVGSIDFSKPLEVKGFAIPSGFKASYIFGVKPVCKVESIKILDASETKGIFEIPKGLYKTIVDLDFETTTILEDLQGKE